MTTIGERITILRKFLGMTQSGLASIMETTQNRVSLMENGRSKPSPEHVEKLVRNAYVNPVWLQSGDGEMFSISRIPKCHLTHEQLDRIIGNTRPESPAVPFYDNPIEGAGDGTATGGPSYLISYPPFNDCTFYRPVWGDSMSPRFSRGDTVACKRLSGHDTLTYGETYLCIFRRGDETVELLRTIRSTDDPSTVKLVPLNPEYDAVTIPRSAIEALYIIKGRIERML